MLGRKVYLPSPHDYALDPLVFSREMPRAPTKSALDNQTLRRQKVGNPKLFGAYPNSHFLKTMPKFQRMDMFNTMFNLYLSGRYFQQDSVNKSSGWKIQGHSHSC